jgi:hypothetical protein
VRVFVWLWRSCLGIEGGRLPTETIYFNHARHDRLVKLSKKQKCTFAEAVTACVDAGLDVIEKRGSAVV